MILSGFADIWLLPAVPFLSARVIGCVRSLWKLTASHHVVTRPIGILGLGCLLAGLTGLLSPVPALPLILLGGAVSGFAMLSVRGADPNDGGDGDDELTRGDDPPPGLRVDAPIDWQLFDSLRRQWDIEPVPRR